MKIQTLCFIIAMPAEASPLIQHFGLTKIDNFFGKLPPLAYKGSYKGTTIWVVVNGQDAIHKVDLVGTQPATLAAQLAIDKINPDMIINAGTAGAFAKNGAQVGDIYLSSGYVFHDRRIPIPGWDQFGYGHYPSFDTTKIAAQLGYKRGLITTGNSLDMCPTDADTINALNGEIKDMEATALAWVASLYNTPIFSVKSITDLMDSDKTTEEEFTANLHKASTALKDACYKIVDYLTDNK